MFKTAASKLAHNTTLPALGGNQDLRPLQHLITAEKTVLISLQKLSNDYGKAAETLRTWGLAEGEDLGSILAASTTLLTHFASALSQYAVHGHEIRDNLKSIRSREEALDELRRRRRSVHRKADDADKKLSKMSPEHKNIESQTELLNRLQDEIRALDSEIMTEEAGLGDFKRSCTRSWLGLKFGGLLECCEKGTIIGEYGKLLTAEIPDEVTQPGMPRSLYYGHNKIELLTNEATQCINEVTLSTGPSAGPRDHRLPPAQAPAPWSPVAIAQPSPINTLPLPPKGPSLDSPISVGPYSAQSVDDFGVPSRPSGPYDNNLNAGAPRFATLPVKTRQDSLPPPTPFSRQDPPSLNTRQQELGDSFSLSIAEALEAKRDVIGEDTTWRGRLSGEDLPPPLPSTGGPQAPPQSYSQNPWASPPSSVKDEQYLSAHRREVSQISDDDDALLAYMTSVDEAPESPTLLTAQPSKDIKAAEDKVEQVDKQDSGGGENHLLEQEASRPVPPSQALTEKASGQDDADIPANRSPRASSVKSFKIEVAQPPPPDDSPERKQTVHRVPPPSFKPEEDERALNAAIAREIGREIDNLDFTPPSIGSIGGQQAGSPSENINQEQQGQVANSNQEFTGNPSENPNREPSPLMPPSAPPTRSEASPQPYTEPPTGVYTAAQAYAQSYQASSPIVYNNPRQGPTAAQAYAQSYQRSSTPPSPSRGPFPSPYESQQQQDSRAMISSNLPPRLQALQNQNPREDSQLVPPRFQGSRTHSPGSPLQREMPPRFQATQIQGHGPPGYPDSLQDPRYPAVGASQQPSSAESSPYRTPAEYPVSSSPRSNLSTPLSQPQQPPQRVSATSNLSASLVPAGARTISAAAFKRPQPQPHHAASGDNLGSPFAPDLQKRLPNSPYMSYHNRGPAGEEYQPRPYPAAGPDYQSQSQSQPQLYASSQPFQPLQQQQIPPQAHPPQLQPRTQVRFSRDLPPPPPGAAAARPISSTSDDYQYDYISAYQTSSDQESPVRAEFAQSAGNRTTAYGGGGGYGGGTAGVGAGGGGGYGAAPPGYAAQGGGQGYDSGRFATNLDGGSLR